MAFKRSTTALTFACLTGLPWNAWAEEAENSTLATPGLRGSFNCRSRNALCGSNSRQTAVCCAGFKCEALMGSFDMRCVDKPSPAPTPARNTCQVIGCGSQGNPGDACECIEECLLRGTCCSDFYSLCKSMPTPPPPPPPSPQPVPTPSPAPAPTPAPTYIDGDYIVYPDKNAYSPYGAVDIDTDDTAPTGFTISECQSRCTSDPECMCATQRQSDGTCWKRKDCVPSQWTSDWNTGYSVYLKRYSPAPAPTPAPSYIEGNYMIYPEKNAYAPYGAVDIDTDATAPDLDSHQCQDRCSADPACMCVTHRKSDGKCWKRKDCVPSGWTSDFNYGYDVYLKLDSR